jgi:hypothetical protein
MLARGPSRASARLARSLSFCILAALTAVAARDAGRNGFTASLEAQGNRERTLFVSAVDEKGEPVEGLGPEAFIVREDNQRREILRVSRATEPIDIAVLVDNSAAASDEVPFIRDGVSKFVAAMAPKGRIAIIALADRPTVFVEYTDDTKRLAEGVGRIFSMSTAGATLLDGIAESSRGLRSRETPRAAIVPIVTDGIEFTNRYSRDVVAELRTAGAALHVLAIGQFVHTEEHAIRERSFLLDDGPRRSGGQRISLLAPHAIASSLQRLARELSAQYKVVYGRPDSPFTPDDFEIVPARAGVTMRATLARGEKR